MAGTRLLTFCSFVAAISVLFPLAINRISVTRAPIDYEAIDSISQFNFHAVKPVEISLLIGDDCRNHMGLELLVSALSEEIDRAKKESKSAGISSTEYTIEGIQLDATFANVGYSVSSVDDSLVGHIPPSSSDAFSFFLICEWNGDRTSAESKQSSLNSSLVVSEENVYIGRHNHGWAVCGGADIATQEGLVNQVRHGIFPTLSRVIMKQLSPRVVSGSGSSALAYRLSFSLLNEDPTERQVEWSFPSAASQYLQPFFASLSPLARLTVESQSLHFGSLAPPASLKHDPFTGGYYVGPRELQSFLTTIPLLGSSLLPPQQQQQGQEQQQQQQQQPQQGDELVNVELREQLLNLVAFVPAPHHTPLHVRPDGYKPSNGSFDGKNGGGGGKGGGGSTQRISDPTLGGGCGCKR